MCHLKIYHPTWGPVCRISVSWTKWFDPFIMRRTDPAFHPLNQGERTCRRRYPAASLKGYHRPHLQVGDWSPPHPRQEWPEERESGESGDGYFLSVTGGSGGTTEPSRSLQAALHINVNQISHIERLERSLPGWGSGWLTNYAALLFTALAGSLSAERHTALMAANGGSVTPMHAQKHYQDCSPNNCKKTNKQKK